MKVLLIDVNCKNSSTGNIVYNLYNYINSSGDEAAVCYGRGPRIEEKNIFKFGIDAETYLHALLTRITGFTGCFSFFSTRRLIKFIKEFNPDVVHIHELHAYFVNIKPLINYLKRRSIPLVWTFHCEFMYTGKCGVSYECQRYLTGCGKCPQLQSYPKTMFFDFTHYMWKQKKEILVNYPKLVIVAPSKWLAYRTENSFLKGKDIRVIHNGIDTDIFKPCSNREELKNKYGITAEKIVLSVASHITSDSNKGARSIYELAEQLFDENIHFILVGADEREIKKQGNITIVPAIMDKNELAKIFSGADVFLICSKKENFPTTSMESQCCGTPVCGFDVGGVRETIVTDAYLAPFGDIQSLKSNLLLALNTAYNPSIARQVLGKERMLDEYYKVYKTIRGEEKENGQ